MSWMMKYLISIMVILSLGGCTSAELAATMYKKCVSKTLDDCPIKHPSEWWIRI